MDNCLLNKSIEYSYNIKENSIDTGYAKLVVEHNKVHIETKIGVSCITKEFVWAQGINQMCTWMIHRNMKHKIDEIQMSKGYAINSKGVKLYYRGQCHIKDLVEFVLPNKLFMLKPNKEITLKVFNMEQMKIEFMNFRRSAEESILFLLPNGKVLYDKNGIAINYINYYSNISIIREV